MTRDQIIARIQARANDIRALGAAAVFLFGSAARDEVGPNRDVVELTNLLFLLQGEIGREIGLATRGGLHPRLRDRIEASAIRVL